MDRLPRDDIDPACIHREFFEREGLSDARIREILEANRAAFRERVEKEASERLIERDRDLMIQHDCRAAYICPNAGTDLDAIAPFTEELGEIVDKMREELANEKRILEGTLDPEYTPILENGFSNDTHTEQQWKPDSRSGFSIIDPTHDSMFGSNILPGSARLLNLDSRIEQYVSRSMPSPENLCSEKSDDCGKETDAMNESSECTVPMTSERMDGTPSEAK